MSSVTLQKAASQALRHHRAVTAVSQLRFHHPDPFNPKMTKGWKAAVKVGVICSIHMKIAR
jgi:hypothetical protein